MSGAGSVRLHLQDDVASIVFDRPEALNAMTWAMYEQLALHCEQLAGDRSVRVVTLRGAGGKAFVAGTDIAQFASFATADDGVAYERRIDAGIAQLEMLPMPVVAVLDGWVVGGGLAIAAACDIRIATPAARFAVPIARTLGNCLSTANTARVVSGFGVAAAKRMLMLAETLSADEARDAGFITRVVSQEALDSRLLSVCETLKTNAPLTMRAAKETIRRIVMRELPGNDDLVRSCYGSADFKEGVDAFVGKRAPVWMGR